MAHHETDHRTGSQRSGTSLEGDTKTGRTGMWALVLGLPVAILVLGSLVWWTQLGPPETPPVDGPEPVPAPEIAE